MLLQCGYVEMCGLALIAHNSHMPPEPIPMHAHSEYVRRWINWSAAGKCQATYSDLKWNHIAIAVEGGLVPIVQPNDMDWLVQPFKTEEYYLNIKKLTVLIC